MVDNAKICNSRWHRSEVFEHVSNGNDVPSNSYQSTATNLNLENYLSFCHCCPFPSPAVHFQHRPYVSVQQTTIDYSKTIQQHERLQRIAFNESIAHGQAISRCESAVRPVINMQFIVTCVLAAYLPRFQLHISVQPLTAPFALIETNDAERRSQCVCVFECADDDGIESPSKVADNENAEEKKLYEKRKKKNCFAYKLHINLRVSASIEIGIVCLHRMRTVSPCERALALAN